MIENRAIPMIPRIPQFVRMSRFVPVVLAALWLLFTTVPQTMAANKETDPIVAKCRADLAARLKLKPSEIKVAHSESVNWPDAALGMPEVGKVYAQVETPGLRLILQARDSRYLYTTSTTAFKYGGPVLLWSYSMLFLKPVPNEPNLNGDLYQCSLLGTNAVRLVSGVSDYYPQHGGIVIIKRRTSRSGHQLLMVNAEKPRAETLLHGAFDFGPAAVNSARNMWAAYVRRGVGGEWTVVVGRLGEKDPDPVVVPLPDDVRPGKITWSDGAVMILARKGDADVAFELLPTAEKPGWKEIPESLYPDYNALVLNKSESLDIEQVQADGKPTVEVARVWFTGMRNVLARIPNFTMKGYDLLGPYVFIWGDMNSRPAASTVHVTTGECVTSFPGECLSMKPFAFRTIKSPLPRSVR